MQLAIYNYSFCNIRFLLGIQIWKLIAGKNFTGTFNLYKFYNFLMQESPLCVSARWSTSSNYHHIWHTGTWLREDHSGKFYRKSCNPVVLQAKFFVDQQKKTMQLQLYQISQEATYASKLEGICSQALRRTLAETHKVDECHHRKYLNLALFLDIYSTRNAQNLLPYLIKSTLTHNNTLQVILKISIFWFSDPILVKLVENP